jgi:putative acetyltransferase
VACCGVKPLGDGAVELKSMYVAVAARRQGLARLLDGLVRDEARRRGATRVELWSDTRFADAHVTYAALGYSRLPGERDLHDLSHSREYPFAAQL